MANEHGGDILDRGQAEKELFPARGLPGGGQLEVRMEISANHPDPDIRGVARRVKLFNLESWHTEWTQVARKNEELAAGFEREQRKLTAHEFYLRAADFYRRAVVYMPDSDPRMLPMFKKLEENFDKAWGVVPPPFERVQIPYEGHMLPALFWPGRGKAGSRLPVVYNYGGADGILLRGEDGGAGQYVRRGMSFIDVDGPGHGDMLRHHKLYAPPDSERVAKAVIDYLVTRPDVDPERIGLHGSSLGGYSGPRCATGEKRIKAVAVWSGAYNLIDDIFDYYPPIQDRLRWLMGAKDLQEAREKIKEFTLIGRAQKIDCPLLVGYSRDDRVMDPRGALNLYENAVNSPDRSMVDGVGHGEKRFDRRTYLADWFMKQLKAG
ncbi:MAG TPA: prolyl oligopeptidase family serine peptidase [Candidatus Binatia bacterium]|nr:prolyl oligopeptidase family serine peptidase [Candidatus Binatia bacterium]